MSFRCGHVGGIACRIARVSYSGELSFEVAVPSGYLPHLWQQALDVGAAYGLAPFGIQALDTLRTEMGYLHVGADTDATTTPGDVGWGAVAARKQIHYVGRRSLALPAHTAAGRPQLVGVVPVDRSRRIEHGSRVFAQRAAPCSIGHVTSACFSPTLGHSIALAMVEGGRARLNQEVWLSDDMASGHRATIVAPSFLNPRGVPAHG